MKWPIACHRCAGPFADPDVAFDEGPEGAPLLAHVSCLLLEASSGRLLGGIAVLDSSRHGSAPDTELDRQAQAFAIAIHTYMDRAGTGNGEAFDLGEWPLVAEIVMAQQEAFQRRRS